MAKGSGNEAKAARADEQARQDRIREGTARINSIFDGTTRGAGKVGANAAFNSKATYYNADGSKWTPPAASGGAGGGSWSPDFGKGALGDLITNGSAMNAGAAAAPVNPADAWRQAVASGKIFSGTQHTGGFGDDFFNDRREAYMNYATPQLEDQYGDAQKQLTFALARGGLLDSSVRGEKAGDLQQLYDTNKQKVADDALAYETQARNNVEDARANLIATLNATGDAQGAAKAAIARSQALSQPDSYSPLTQLFVDFTSTLGTQAALERANAMSGGATGSRYNTNLFGNSGNSVRVT